MASLLRQILRKPCYSASISPIFNRNSSNFITPLFIQSPNLSQTNFDHGGGINPSYSDLMEEEEFAHHSGLRVYPSFSFGHFLNPIAPPGSDSHVPFDELREGESDGSGMVWADSVKKKRKRKMNKHKYKKLRKSLRRKT